MRSRHMILYVLTISAALKAIIPFPMGKLTAEIGICSRVRHGSFYSGRTGTWETAGHCRRSGLCDAAGKKTLAGYRFPGMKVLQFAFDGDPKNDSLPQNFTTTHCVVYTGTHDNMTLRAGHRNRLRLRLRLQNVISTAAAQPICRQRSCVPHGAVSQSLLWHRCRISSMSAQRDG